MLDCIITVKGKGRTQQGCLKNDKTGPLHSMIKDLEAYYKAAYEHCLTCKACDPNEVLKRFLENRDKPTSGRTTTNTSALLVNLAAKFVKKVPGTDPDWLHKYVVRCENIDSVVKHRKLLTHDQLVNAARKASYHGWLKLADEFTDDEFLESAVISVRQVWKDEQDHPMFRTELKARVMDMASRSESSVDFARKHALGVLADMLSSGGDIPEDLTEVRKMMVVAGAMLA